VIKKRLLLSGLLSPLLLVLVAYVAWPVWTPPVIRALLADVDMQLLRAEISRPSWSYLALSDVSFSYQTDEHVATLNLPEVALRYSLRQLLQGRVETVQIPSAHLQLKPAPDTEDKPAIREPLSIPITFPQTLLAQLPVAQLQVDSLQLLLPEYKGYQRLLGSLHYSADQLAVKLASRVDLDAGSPELKLDFYADAKNNLQLNLTKNTQVIVALESQIIDGSKQWQGELTIDLQAGSELLQQLKMLDSGYQLTGKTQLSWQAVLPETIDENSWRKLELTGSLSSKGGLAVQKVPVQNDIEQTQFKVAVDFEAENGIATVNVAELNINGQLDLSNELANWLPEKSLKKLPVTLRMSPAAQLHIDLQFLETALQQGAIEVLIGRRESPLFTQLQLQSLTLQPQHDWRAIAHFQTQMAVKQLKYGKNSAESVAFSAIGQARIKADSVRLKLDANSSLQAKTIQVEQIKAPMIDVRVPRAFEVVWQQQKLTIADVSLGSADIQLDQQNQHIEVATVNMQLKDFSLDLSHSPRLGGLIDSSLKGIKVTAGELSSKPLDLQGSWQLRGERLKGRLQLNDRAGLITLHGVLKHQFGSGLGRLETQLNTLEFHQNKTYFPHLIAGWPYPLDLFAGQLDANALLTWGASQVHVKGRVQLSDVGGFYDTNLFHGLSTELVIDAPLADLTVFAEQFKVESLDVGIPIENLTFALQSTTGRVQLTDFQAELLGGRVGQKLVSYDWMQEDNELLLQVQGIQLNELLQLELGIEGYGVLDGELPLHISADGITMALGQIQARSGGVIRYEGGQSVSDAAANIGVGFALEALNNFHYDVLEIKADYSESGELSLVAAMLGRNPDMQEQRPVRYNVNIKENIPALIKSLKLTQDISDDIERRLKTFYDRDKQEIIP